MKFLQKLSLILFPLFLLDVKSSSLSDYEIQRLCKKVKKELTCIKNLKKRNDNLKKGIQIEIPIIPYRK